MHILWLVRTTLPQAAAACGLAGASDVSGSWLTGQLAALRACPDLQLTAHNHFKNSSATFSGVNSG